MKTKPFRKCRKAKCPVCRPDPPARLSVQTARGRIQVAKYVRRRWNFLIDDLYVDRSGWVTRDNQGVGYVKKVLTTVTW